MIAKYKDQLYNVNIEKNVANIWAYKYIEGFDERITRRGKKYYEKYLDKTLLQEVYVVDFFASWKEKEFMVLNVLKDLMWIKIYSEDYEFANENDFEEFERGCWQKTIKIDECSSFKMIKRHILVKEKEIKNVTKEELYELWNENIVELR